MEGKDSELCRNFVGGIIPLAPLKRKCIFEERNSYLEVQWNLGISFNCCWQFSFNFNYLQTSESSEFSFCKINDLLEIKHPFSFCC